MLVTAILAGSGDSCYPHDPAKNHFFQGGYSQDIDHNNSLERNMNKVTIFILVSLLMITGCNNGDEETSNPVTPVVYEITLTGLPEVIVAIEGAARSYPFTIQVITTEGLVAREKAVQLRVTDGSWQLIPPEVVTNQSGLAQAVFEIVMVRGQSTSRITASLEGSSVSTDIRLIGVNRPTRLDLETENPSVVIRMDESVEMPIKATVRDESGRGVSGVNLAFALQPASPGEPTFGALGRPGSTNTNGQVEVRFRSLGRFGRQVIHCNIDEPNGYLGDIADELVIEVFSLDDRVGFFAVNANPTIINLTPANPETVMVDVTIRDMESQAFEGVDVRFTCDYGSITPTGTTNASGNLRVFNVFYHDQVPDSTVQSTLYATIPGTDWRATATVSVIPQAEGQARFALVTDTKTIYADNGITFANLTAVLKDRFDQAVSYQEIQFLSDFGVAQSPSITDVDGIAHSIFTDLGNPSVDENGQPDSAVVTARVRSMRLERSVRIMIQPWTEVAEIEVLMPRTEVVAGSGDSLEINAVCYLSPGIRAGSGIFVYFEANAGRTYPSIELTDLGVATSFYYPTFTARTDTLRVWVRNRESIITTIARINVLPGSPFRAVVSAEPDTLVAGDPVNTAQIRALFSDINNNPVSAGQEVEFTTTLGSVTDVAYTDAAGVATAILRPGEEIGAALVTATAQGDEGPVQGWTGVTIVDARIGSLDLTVNPTQLRIQDQTAILRVVVFDEHENVPEDPVSVVFQMINDLPPPLGCTIGDTSQVFYAETEDGVATAEFNCGQRSGVKFVRAYTWRDYTHRDTVASVVEVTVLPDPASSAELIVNSNGADAGGGAWMLEAWARFWDIYRNPVEDGLPVSFWVDPEIASISVGRTGNENMEGEPQPGTAFTTVVFQSTNTFEPVEIGAAMNTEQGTVETTLDMVLPLQEGRLMINASPRNWHFDEDHRLASIWIWALLSDGHDVSINNGPVIFGTTRGRLFWYNREEEAYVPLPDPARRLTGLNDLYNAEERGVATVYLRAEEGDIFINPESNEEIVIIEAWLERDNDVEPVQVIVFFTR